MDSGMSGWERHATRGNVAVALGAALVAMLAGAIGGGGPVAVAGGALAAVAVVAGARMALAAAGVRDGLVGAALAALGVHAAMLALARPEAEAAGLALGIALGLALRSPLSPFRVAGRGSGGAGDRA